MTCPRVTTALSPGAIPPSPRASTTRHHTAAGSSRATRQTSRASSALSMSNSPHRLHNHLPNSRSATSRREPETVISGQGRVEGGSGSARIGCMRISARNQLAGSVVEVTPGAVTTTVKVRLAGGDVMTSSITKEAADELGLAAGNDVVVIVKASDVMLAVD